MCGRYALTKTELLEEYFEFSFTGHQIIPRFNIAPNAKIPVIRLREDGQRELIDMRWGLVPIWSKPGEKLPLMINARAEMVSSKPAFRDAFKRRRCIVPASGYYEWQKLPGGEKQPFYNQPQRWATHWVCWPLGECEGRARDRRHRDNSGSEETQEIHDRMPVILEKPDFARWLVSSHGQGKRRNAFLRHLRRVRSLRGQSVAGSIPCAMTTRA